MNASIQYTERVLRLVSENGHESTFPALWLYDNRPDHRDQRTGQRIVDVTDLPLAPKISRAERKQLRLPLAPGALPVQRARTLAPARSDHLGGPGHFSFMLDGPFGRVAR